MTRGSGSNTFLNMVLERRQESQVFFVQNMVRMKKREEESWRKVDLLLLHESHMFFTSAQNCWLIFNLVECVEAKGFDSLKLLMLPSSSKTGGLNKVYLFLGMKPRL
ncbi:hypothetical protein NL676_003595 [Syzygium grande]|nr:hypothetical protein NL676_003595 [Syzygium grande]